MHLNESPARLSVVLITLDNFKSLKQLLCYLEVQTVRQYLEILIVCPSEGELGLEPDALTCFACYKVVEIGPFRALHQPRVAAIRNAGAPVIAFTEDHCFPAPDWAEALLRAHEGPWAAVGPVLGLANPQLKVAWVSYFMQYGEWVDTGLVQSHESEDVAGHNSSYKVEAMLEYGDDLDRIMVFETVLHEDLRARGKKLYVAADARAWHVFITRFKPFCIEHVYIGRLLASTRRRRWGLPRRLLYIFGSPLIPLVRFVRIVGMVRRNGWAGQLLPGMLPSLLAGLAASAWGEFLGYVAGAGNADEGSVDLDMNRWRYITDDEKRQLWSGKRVRFSLEPPVPGKSAVLEDQAVTQPPSSPRQTA